VPMRLNNNDLITITGVKNSISAEDRVVSESEFEKEIAYQLSQNISPTDLSNNFEELSDGTSLSLDGGKNKFNGIMISNNEDLIDSETMAIKFSYITNTENTADVVKSYSLHSGFNQNITLIGTDTSSYMTSHLKIDVSYNNDSQQSLDMSGSAGNWNMYIDRSGNSNTNNYFASINSHLNTSDGSYPMKIEKVDSLRLYNDCSYVSAIDPTTNQFSYGKFNSNFSFETNRLVATVDPTHNYVSSDFTMYKLVQDEPTITQDISGGNASDLPGGNASDLPVGNASGNDLTTPSLAEFQTNVSAIVGEDINLLKDGYNIQVVIGEDNAGGFQLDDPTNGVLSIDTSNVVDSYSFLEAGISNTTNMYVDISNGSVTLEGTDTADREHAPYNENIIDLGLTGEHLVYPYNTENGLVQIKVQPVTERINVVDVSSSDWYANDVKIIYNCDEAIPLGVSSHLDYSMLIHPHVEYAAGIVVPTTTGNSYSSNDNSFNLLKSNDSVLVIANDSSFNPTMPNYQDMSFNSNIHQLYSDHNTIVYVTVQNTNILTQDTPLIDNDGVPVPNSISTVKIQNINLDESDYSDYQIRLNTKTITDLSNAALSASSNGWNILSTNGSELLHTSSIKNSIMYDDCLFMRSGLDTSFNYTFSIVNPTVTNAQSIKHRVDISFSEVSIDQSGNPHLVPNYVYLDEDDITYTNINYVNTSTVNFTNYTVSQNNYGLTVNNTIVKQVTNTVTYYASFDPKLPFYTNIKLSSPLITEYVHSYKLYDSNNAVLPDVYLKYLTNTVTNTPLSLVTVSQSETQSVTNFYKTSLKVTPSNCSTLTAILQGKDSTNTFVDIPNVASQDQDPWFNTTTQFTGVNGATVVSVVVQVTYPTELNKEYYLVDTTNKPGENVSFTTKLYKYDTTNKSGTNDSFNQFNAYNSAWVLDGNVTLGEEYQQENLPQEIALNNTVELDANNHLTLKIFSEDGNSILATLEQPNTIINDFNIIYCFNPLVRVIQNVIDFEGNTVVDNVYSYSVATLTASNTKREVFLDDGVYAYTSVNPPRYSYVHFLLDSDEVKVDFVLDSDYAAGGFNNGWNNFIHLTDISGVNSLTQIYDMSGIDGLAVKVLSIKLLSGDSNGLNSTQPVIFSRYRGHTLVGSGTDSINIVRTSSTAVFVLDGSNGTYTQTFNDFAENGVYTVNNAVNESNSSLSFDLGLKINGLLSIMEPQYETTRFYITITGASISWTLSNPNTTTGAVYKSDSSNLTQSTFSDLFGWRSRRIFSDPYEINITYNIPDIQVYNLDVSGKEVYGNPANKTSSEWVNLTTHDLTNTNGIKISGVDVIRTQSYVPSSFTAYTVILPPQLKISYNSGINTTSFPFVQANATPVVYYLTLVDPDETSYDINNKFALINTNIPSIQNYTNLKNEKIVILGNYVNINYYYDVSANESSNTARLVYSGTFDGLKGLNNNNLIVSMTSNSVVYDVRYKQFIGGSGNANTNINSTYNVRFTISDAFIGPPPVSIYFDLITTQSTVVSFFQSNINLIDNSYVLVIDKYECAGIDYNTLIDNNNVNQLFFIAASHYTSSFAVDGKQLPIGGTSLNINRLFSSITKNDIVFVKDNDFTTQNVGVTLSALSTQGIANLESLVRYSLENYLLSTISYIRMPDIINVTSLFGSSVYRVTNSGNVRTPVVTTYAMRIVDGTQLYSEGSAMNNENISNVGFINSETIIDTMPNAP
jgi:hypothetical protein